MPQMLVWRQLRLSRIILWNVTNSCTKDFIIKLIGVFYKILVELYELALS